MIRFRDRTYCPFWETCADGDECDRALTPQVVAAAQEWMENPPICQYLSKPECFVPIMGTILPKSGTEE